MRLMSVRWVGIVFLAMGGIGLGKAVLSSGLLDDMFVVPFFFARSHADQVGY